MHLNVLRLYLHITPKTPDVFEQCHQSEARYGRSRLVFEAFSRDAEPHRLEADGDVVRPVQADCGVHPYGIPAVAGQCGPD